MSNGMPSPSNIVVDAIEEAIAMIQRPINDYERDRGWTVDNQSRMLQLLERWKAAIVADGQVTPQHFKGISRWFADEGVGSILATDPPDPWHSAIVDIDNSIDRVRRRGH